MKGFGRTDSGQDCHLYTIENETIRASVTDYGATLVSLVYKPQNIDAVEGFDDVSGYIHEVPYMGACIGRTCNRIGKGRFSLNGNTYQIPVNNNGNALHGGEQGFDKRIFAVKEEKNRLILTLVSPDGDQGYPGNLHLEAIYELLLDGLKFTYTGTSDQDTLLSVTNHSFFNLDQSGSVLSHEIVLHASRFAHVDKDGLTLDETEEVQGTPFDFTEFKTIGRDIGMDHEQLKNAHGYDHHFLADGEGFRVMAQYRTENLEMTVSSDLPGFHLYTANFLNREAGKGGMIYPARSAVCFETQYYPNAINYDSQEKPILRKNQKCSHMTSYTFKGRK